MTRLPEWRCYEDTPTIQLKVETGGGLELLVKPGGTTTLLRGDQSYHPSGYQRLTIHNPISDESPYTIGYEFANYRHARTLSETPADVSLNGFNWEGLIDFTSETSSIGYLYVNNRVLISRNFEGGTPPVVIEGAAEFFARYKAPFLTSLDACSDLIYAGLKIVELAYRGEHVRVGGYHMNFNDNERLAATVTLDLISANLRLADFRTINPFLTPLS